MSNFNVLQTDGVPVKLWTKHVPAEEQALQQLRNIASLPFVFKWVAGMPDVHLGIGATIGSVIPTRKALIPAAVGVDIGCGMCAVRTSLKAEDLPTDLSQMRWNIENVVPLGQNGHTDLPDLSDATWKKLKGGYDYLIDKYPECEGKHSPAYQLGTLGSGNHFIEVCLDTKNSVWVMLHSGSRNIGNRIGQHFIKLAEKDMEQHFIKLPDKKLAYLVEGTENFDEYWSALKWAQNYAALNRKIMLDHVVEAMKQTKGVPPFQLIDKAVNCHHNYAELENHYGENVYVTRKGAVRARKDDLGIIPGSMGARSFIVRGKGCAESFCSCSHGAGRVMSRSEAKKLLTVEDHIKDTKGVECRKDKDVLDETPKAYKDIQAVMKSQEDLVEIVHTLKQILCVKG